MDDILTEDFFPSACAAGLQLSKYNVVLEGEEILHSRMKKLLIIGCCAAPYREKRLDVIIVYGRVSRVLLDGEKDANFWYFTKCCPCSH